MIQVTVWSLSDEIIDPSQYGRVSYRQWCELEKERYEKDDIKAEIRERIVKGNPNGKIALFEGAQRLQQRPLIKAVGWRFGNGRTGRPAAGRGFPAFLLFRIRGTLAGAVFVVVIVVHPSTPVSRLTDHGFRCSDRGGGLRFRQCRAMSSI